MGLKYTSAKATNHREGYSVECDQPENIATITRFSFQFFPAKAVRFDNVVAIKLSDIHLFYLPNFNFVICLYVNLLSMDYPRVMSITMPPRVRRRCS